MFQTQINMSLSKFYFMFSLTIFYDKAKLIENYSF